MASGLLLLLDDIATILDDISTMTKVAVQKTAGVLGDDLALNAQQVTGVRPIRELAIVWGVAKGSFINKTILVPSALLLSIFLPVLVMPLLMIGGIFLCYEGCEKVFHKFFHRHQDEEDHHEMLEAVASSEEELVAVEKEKIAGAIRTDFILSAEIIVITLGAVSESTLAVRIGVMIGVSLIMTIGVYGLVAAIVKIDDLGYWLSRREGARFSGKSQRGLGELLLWVSPQLLRFLSVAGTLAMFLVGGSILLHGIPTLHHWIEERLHPLASIPAVGWLVEWLSSGLASAIVGVLSGGMVLAVVMGLRRVFRGKTV